jgi:hypothetical protein
MSGSLTLLGITMATNEFTMFHDESTAAVDDFGFDDVAVGDRVEVRAYLDGETPVAARVEREDPGDDVTLKAPVDSVDRPAVTLLEVMVFAGADTVFQNAAKEVVDADTFFTLVTTDSLVKAEGVYDGTSILASEMYLRACEESCL